MQVWGDADVVCPDSSPAAPQLALPVPVSQDMHRRKWTQKCRKSWALCWREMGNLKLQRRREGLGL